MGIGKDRAMGRQLRTLFNVGAIGDLSDGQLLERFASAPGEGAELAFAALVERHGPMVLRVCRGVLDDPHDSDDAFQATFLVLVAKGRTLWVRDSLGPWLHQVAHRTARCARASAARRKRLERSATLARAESENRLEPNTELERVLLEEVARLPEPYRAPVVLCDLEGRTHEAAARALGWPIGTVKSRQARARQRLRDQLTRRGFAPALLALPRLSTSIPSILVDSTTALAARFIASRAFARGSAAWLAQEVIRSMTILRFGKIATLILALGATGSGAVIVAQGSGEPSRKLEPKPQATASPKPETKPQPQPQPEPDDDTVVTVKPGKLELTETAPGLVEPTKSQDLLSEIAGQTVILSIKPEGSKIRKGEVVCELDSSTLRDSLVNQRITVQQAEAAYKQAGLVREVSEYAVKEYRELVLPQERAGLKAKIAAAEQGMTLGEARIERTKVARKKLDAMFAATQGPANPADIVADLNVNDLIEAAERNAESQKQALSVAKADLDRLERFTIEQATRKLTVDYEKSRANELSMQTSWQLEQAREKKLERQIEKCTLTSSGDGMLVYANNPGRGPNPTILIEEGATVRERQLICKIVDLNAPMRVNAKVSEALVDQVPIGAKAKVKVDALPNQIFTGTVVRVAPMADANTLFRDNRKVYSTLILLDQTDPNLRPGMSARTNITLLELDNILVIPSESVGTGKDGLNYVSVKTSEGKIERRTVVLGKSGGRMVLGVWEDRGNIEIKEGLKAGDQVLRKPEPLQFQ